MTEIAKTSRRSALRVGDRVAVRVGAYDAPEIHDGHTGVIIVDRSRPGVCVLRDVPVGGVERSWYRLSDLEATA